MKPPVLPLVLLVTLAALPASAQQGPSPASGPPPSQITALVSQVTALFPKVEGDIITVEDGRATLSIGKRDGVVVGVDLEVYREGEELKHPKTGEVLGRKEDVLGRVLVEQVAEAYSTARISKGKGMVGGDKVRVTAGKVRLTILPLSTGIRDNLIEAAVQELVDGFTRTGRFHVGMGDSIGVALGQQGISPEQALDGKGLVQTAEKFKVENLLVVHFKRVETKPYMDVRFFSLPRTVPDVTTAFFVPPSIRPTQQGSRFSQGGPANPPQAKQRSLLARLLGRELEAGSYSSGENSIPLKEVAKFPFAVVAIDVAVTPKDKTPQLGRVISIYFVDLDGDGQFEVVGARHDPNIGLSSFILGMKDGKPRYLAEQLPMFLFPVDTEGKGYKHVLWAQRYTPEKFFTTGQADQMAWKNGKLVTEKALRVHSSFRPMGATFSNVNGKEGVRALAFIDEFNRLQIALDGEDLWRSGTAVGGGASTIEQIVPGVGRSAGAGRSAFYKIEPNPLAIDLDGDGIDEILVPQNTVKEGLLGIVFKGPAGFRLQSIDTGFEGIITALGGFKTDDATQPTIIATVVRFKNFLKTSGETQVIMTVPQE
jgi:hypothetical protein